MKYGEVILQDLLGVLTNDKYFHSLKIAIYFFVENHYTFLEQIIKQLPKSAEIELFCSKFYFNIYKEKFKCHKPSLFNLLLKSSSYEKIIIDEVSGRFLLFIPLFVLRRSKIYIVLHNLRSWLHPQFFKNFKTFLNSLIRQFIVLLFFRFIVVGTGLKKYAYSMYSNKFFYFIPFGLRDDIRPIENKEVSKRRLKLVVPGTVGSRRKYDYVFKLMDDADTKHLIEFVLLGAPEDDYGKSIIRKVAEGKYVNIKTFDRFISESEYDTYMSEADYIFSDFDVKYLTAYGQSETYGISKETGVSFLIASYEKLAILPENFKVMEELQSQVMSFYDFDSLKKIIVDLSKKGNQHLQFFRNEARNNKLKLIKQIDKL